MIRVSTWHSRARRLVGVAEIKRLLREQGQRGERLRLDFGLWPWFGFRVLAIRGASLRIYLNSIGPIWWSPPWWGWPGVRYLTSDEVRALVTEEILGILLEDGGWRGRLTITVG